MADRAGDVYVFAKYVSDGYYTTSHREGVVFAESVTAKEKYLLRGYLYERNPPEYEQWVSTGLPFSSNPSGEPIQNVTVLAVWQSA